MFSKKIRCVCGHEFNYTHNADTHEVIDFSAMKAAAVEEVNYHRRNVAYGTPTIEVEEDYSDVSEVSEVIEATCPSCFTKLPIQYHFDVGAGCEIEIGKRLQDRIAPLYQPPMSQIHFEQTRYPIQPVVENYVYNAQLSRANGRATLQCTNTKKIKYL